MNNIYAGRECRGKYYITSTQETQGHYEEFEKGTFLGFGIDYEEFEGGPGQYTTAIVELADGQVVVTVPGYIQFINKKRIDPENPLMDDVGASDLPDNEIPSEDKKNAGWSNKDIADEMHMTPNAVANSLSTHKELIEELKKI